MSPAELRKFTSNRAAYIPYSVNARVDSTVLPELMVEVTKSNLPDNASIDKVTGDLLITLPGIAGKIENIINTTTNTSLLQ